MIRQQYPSAKGLLSFDLPTRGLFEGENRRKAVKGPGKANVVFLHGIKYPPESAVTEASRIVHQSERERQFLLEIISLDVEEPRDSQWGPINRCLQHWRPLMFIPLLLHPCLFQLVKRLWLFPKREKKEESRRGYWRITCLMHSIPMTRDT